MRALLLPLALALSLSAAQTAPTLPGDQVRVRGVGADTAIALRPSDAGGLVRADVMARLLGGALDSISPGVWRLTLYGASIELTEGIAFAGFNGFVLPLLEPTQRVDGEPFVTLQLFSEIIPRFGIGVQWDRARGEVRLLQAVARAENDAATPADTVPTPVRPVANGHGSTVTTTATTTAAPLPTNATNAPRAPVVPSSTVSAAPAVANRPAGALSRRYVVAVDAGHGGADPGNPGVIINGRRVNESRLTLAIALEVEKALRAKGIGVVMTRRTDTLIARDDRGPIANNRKADIFVSIHTNAANPSWRNGAAVRGFETYFLSTARTEDERRVANMENDVVRFEAETHVAEGDPLAFILNDLAQNEHLRESSDLAQVMQLRLSESHPGPNRGVKQAGFAVLASAYMPAVLIEVGFGTNAPEARWMASVAGQRSLAQQIAEGVYEYLQHYERRARAAIR
jgi:N-acetylmuramoyl-L-alanine amidase